MGNSFACLQFSVSLVESCSLGCGYFHSGNLVQVSGVAFDSYWSPPSSDGNGENVYRFGSVGQVCPVSIARTVV